MKVLCLALGIAALASGAGPPRAALAVTAPAQVRHVSYVIGYEPVFGNPHIPYLGWLQLTINGGIISGTYRGLSILPDDPFVDRTVSVSGGESAGSIQFNIGNGPNLLTFNGRVYGNWIQGSATWRGQLYRLSGEVGKPRGM